MPIATENELSAFGRKDRMSVLYLVPCAFMQTRWSRGMETKFDKQ